MTGAEAGLGAGGPGDWVRRDEESVWHGFTQMASYAENAPVVVERAEGHELVGVDGRRYLDAISSLWVNTLGHQVPELDEAVRTQLSAGAHTTMLGNGNRRVIELAEALRPLVPVPEARFLFASDGASAVEQALKIAFQYWVNRGSPRNGFLALTNAYHGDTVGALSLGDQGFGTSLFQPLLFPVTRAPGPGRPGWPERTLALIREQKDSLCAVVIEPLVQAAGGILVGEAEDFARLGRCCREEGVLLIADEVATGFGRTGALFASSLCSLTPDLMCLGKGITGGYLPMSATVASATVQDAFRGPDLSPLTFHHGHSYGGNALAAAVALRHLELLSKGRVLENVRLRSAQLASLLEPIRGREDVAEVRLQGLMCGVELRSPRRPGVRGRKVCAAATRAGVLLRPLGDVVVLMPPLNITAEEVRLVVSTLVAALDEVPQ